MWLPICASDYWCAVRKACMRIRGCIRCSIRYDDVWWKHDEDKRDGQTSLFERLIKKSSLCWKRDAVRLRVNRYLSRRVARYTIGNNGPFRLILLPSLSLHPSSSKLRRSRLARDSCAPIICMRKHTRAKARAKATHRLFVSLTNYTILNGSRKNGERDSVAYVPSGDAISRNYRRVKFTRGNVR